LKTTQLVIDAINWRVADKRLQEEEYPQLGIDEDDARLKFQREKRKKTLRKCIQKLALLGTVTKTTYPQVPIEGFTLGTQKTADLD
jgi:hypothetical protein